MNYWNWSSASASTNIISQESSASTTIIFHPTSWVNVYDNLPELIWWPNLFTTYDLAPEEKSIHGQPRGKLKPPKIKFPREHLRGFRPKISFNYYHKE